MPLTEHQRAIARLLATNRSPDSYLAGGAAMHIEPNSKRYSNDLDYFHDSEERVASAFAADRVLLEGSGYTVEVTLQQPGFARALVQVKEQATKVEWAHDSAFRFLPVIKSDVAGFLLSPIDLAINKLLALVGRDEPRDYLDIHEAIAHTLPLGALCWAAAGKDPGFTPLTLLDLLRRRGRYRPEDFARLRLVTPPDLPVLKQVWLRALEEATTFVNQQDPATLGCLFFEPESQRFLQPAEGQRTTLHFGRPGGVMPLVAEP